MVIWIILADKNCIQFSFYKYGFGEKGFFLPYLFWWHKKISISFKDIRKRKNNSTQKGTEIFQTNRIINYSIEYRNLDYINILSDQIVLKIFGSKTVTQKSNTDTKSVVWMKV